MRKLSFDERDFMRQLGVEALTRRGRLHDARTALGAPDLRHQRA